MAYPGKIPRSVGCQLTEEGHRLLRDVKKAQRKLNFKRKYPSTGDVFEGLLRLAGRDLVLPEPTQIK